MRFLLGAVVGTVLFAGCSSGVQQTPNLLPDPSMAPGREVESVVPQTAEPETGTASTPVEQEEAEPSAPAPDQPSEATVVTGNTEFAFGLYRRLAGQEGNLALSPYSLSVALAMTYAGARGKTAKQLAYATHLAHPPGQLHQRFSTLQADLKGVDSVTLHIANALWPSDAYPFKADYLSLLKETYQSPITPLDYEQDFRRGRRVINRWVGKQTKGKITNLIEPGVLDTLTKLVLTNAIYFTGNWAVPFDKKLTKRLPFHLSEQQTVKVPMMADKRRLKFYEDHEVQLVELPYEGERLAMVLMLPKKGNTLAKLEQSLNGDLWASWAGSLNPLQVQLMLPRFEISSAFKLEEQLKKMGVLDAFDRARADFSGMAERAVLEKQGNLYISAVIHKAFTKVNEKGTTAAAASAVVMETYSAPAEFRADRPFLFVIRDTKTGTVLFIGRVSNPKNK